MMVANPITKVSLLSWLRKAHTSLRCHTRHSSAAFRIHSAGWSDAIAFPRFLKFSLLLGPFGRFWLAVERTFPQPFSPDPRIARLAIRSDSVNDWLVAIADFIVAVPHLCHDMLP